MSDGGAGPPEEWKTFQAPCLGSETKQHKDLGGEWAIGEVGQTPAV
jgi:hypothetical protein